jgi:DNA mismatch repair protein MSH5
MDTTETGTEFNDRDEMRSLFGEEITPDEVFMAVDVRERSTVGCAYYVAREEKLYMMQDCKFGDLTTVDTCNKA